MLIGYYLIYLLVFRSTGDTGAAFWTALIYACLGGTAWQVSWVVNRQHLLLVIFFMASLIFYGRYLSEKRKSFRWWSFLFFALALLLKEAAACLGPILLFFALIVERQKLRSQIKPLLPFFLLLIAFIGARTVVINQSRIPEANPNPPPMELTPARAAYEYGRSLLATFLQSHGTCNPSNKDFPVYGTGIKNPRDRAAAGAGGTFFLLGAIWLFSRGGARRKLLFFFGLAFLLTANVLVAAWYRTNRLFLSSLGLAIMAGPIVSSLGGGLSLRRFSRWTILGSAALAAFLVYFAVNIAAYLEIQRALRPDGYLSLTWDSWLYEELTPWMKEEQLRILRDKLERSGRWEWARSLPREAAEFPEPREYWRGIVAEKEKKRSAPR